MNKKRDNTANVPNLRFPGFEGEWEKRKLNDIATFYSGGTPLTSKREYFDGDIPFIRSGEINSKETLQFISELGLKNSSSKMVQKGDILYALYGATSGEVGISKIRGAINQAVLCIKSTENHYFIYSFLLNKKESIIRTYLQGGQGNLSAEIVKQIKLSIPTIEEQSKISRLLLLIDERTETQNKIIDNLELLKKGLLQKVFSQKIRFKNEKNKMFSEWKKKSLGQICKIVKGEQLNREELTETGTYPCQNGGVLPSGFTENFNTNENTITISEGGNSCGHINYQKTKFWSGGHCYSLLELENEIDVIFLFQYLKFNENKIKRLRVGSGLPNIQRKDIILFKVYLPSIEEQTKIANFLSSIDTKIDVEVQLLQKLKEQKKYLLQQLFC